MIAILDSGIGGLSVYAEIVRLMPKESIYYYADSAHCPYGDRSDSDIIALSIECVSKIANQGIDVIVIACNTITSVAGEVLRDKFRNISIVGMEPAIKPAALLSKSKIVGVLATRATLAAEKYHKTRDAYAKAVKVIEIVGDGLVDIVENDLIETADSEQLVRTYIERLEREGADSVVLGCTHYPFLKGVIEKVSNHGIHIIDPASAVANRVKDILIERGEFDNGEEFKEIFFSSKDGQSERIAQIAHRLRGY